MIETLSGRLEEVRKQIAVEGQAEVIIQLQAQEENILAEIERLKTSQTIEATANEIASNMELFKVGNDHYTLAELAGGEDELIILRIGIAQIGQAQAQKWLEDINTQKTAYEAKFTALTTELADAKKAIDDYQEENAQLHLDNEDLSENRDAAVRAAEEAQAESARKDARIADLERQLASAPTANAVVEISSTEELQAAAQRLREKQEAANKEREAAANASKIRIYGVQQIDGTGAKYSAYRADNDEFITFGWLEKNKYIELTSEEVQRFREELAQAQQALLESTAAEEPVQVPNLVNQFQAEDEPAVPEHVLDGAVAPEPSETVPQTLEDRVAALEAAVFGQVKAAA